MSETPKKSPLKVWISPKVTSVAAMKSAQDGSKSNVLTEDGLGNGPAS